MGIEYESSILDNEWVLLDYKTLMNKQRFYQEANIFLIKLKKDQDITDCVNRIIGKMGLDKENINLRPSLEGENVTPLYIISLYNVLNLGLESKTMTIFLYLVYPFSFVAGQIMIINGNKPQIELSIRSLTRRGIGQKRIKQAFTLLYCAYFIILAIIGFALGLILGFSISLILVGVNPFFVLNVTTTTILIFIGIIMLSILVSAVNQSPLNK